MYRSRITTLLFVFGLSLLPIFAVETDLQLPSEGSKVSDFVPKGWRISKQTSGDLDGDGTKDHAFILIAPNDQPEGSYRDNNQRKSRRPLIILFTKPDGQLHLACQSSGAIIWGEIADELAINTIEIDIKKGNLIVSIGNGATSIRSFDSTYRWQHNRFELIGFTDNAGRTDQNVYLCSDTNLNTSYDEESHSTGVHMDGSGIDKTTKYNFYFLRAGKVNAPPALTLDEQKWPGFPVQLKRSVNVAIGKSNWHNANDFSAEVKGVVADKNLFIACRVTDKKPDKHVSLRLRDAQGRIVVPAQVESSITKQGELIAARFPLNKLKQDQETHNIQASVQVVKTDDAGKPLIILSTSCDAEKHTGQIRIRKTPELPTLANFDWASRDD